MDARGPCMMVARSTMVKLVWGTSLILLLQGISLLPEAMAVVYIVGGPGGWGFAPTASYYSDWASENTFVPGDALSFRYNPMEHNVQQVNLSDYTTCNTLNPIRQLQSGSDLITLETPGTYCFICGVAGHCQGAGMVLKLLVTGSTAPPSPHPPPSPPPRNHPRNHPQPSPPPPPPRAISPKAAAPAPFQPAHPPPASSPPPPPPPITPPSPPAGGAPPPSLNAPSPPPPPPPPSSPEPVFSPPQPPLAPGSPPAPTPALSEAQPRHRSRPGDQPGSSPPKDGTWAAPPTAALAPAPTPSWFLNNDTTPAPAPSDFDSDAADPACAVGVELVCTALAFAAAAGLFW